MITTRELGLSSKSTLDAQVVAECDQSQFGSSLELVAIAVSRGCRHYAPWAVGVVAAPELVAIRHEVLACALLRFPMPQGFNAFRCGVMVLSDLGNQSDIIATAADHLGVVGRIGYVAKLGLVYDPMGRDYWAGLQDLFPGVDKDPALPGLSRFVSETHLTRGKRGVTRVWLRTHFTR